MSAPVITVRLVLEFFGNLESRLVAKSSVDVDDECAQDAAVELAHLANEALEKSTMRSPARATYIEQSLINALVEADRLARKRAPKFALRVRWVGPIDVVRHMTQGLASTLTFEDGESVPHHQRDRARRLREKRGMACVVEWNTRRKPRERTGRIDLNDPLATEYSFYLCSTCQTSGVEPYCAECTRRYVAFQATGHCRPPGLGVARAGGGR